MPFEARHQIENNVERAGTEPRGEVFLMVEGVLHAKFLQPVHPAGLFSSRLLVGAGIDVGVTNCGGRDFDRHITACRVDMAR